MRSLRNATGLSQDQFALAYGLEPATVRNWEQGGHAPDPAARNYLPTITGDPEGMRSRRTASLRHFRRRTGEDGRAAS
ncbi:helix-turn-helix domain-containing protein [Caenispirillum salinarum]|uniref:helix-turn-helix domain-containing protein n=1 Tax=Caenispirillum salinarum TaxID=859058 RepID=UPI00384DA507